MFLTSFSANLFYQLALFTILAKNWHRLIDLPFGLDSEKMVFGGVKLAGG